MFDLPTAMLSIIEGLGAFGMIVLMQLRTQGATFDTHFGRCLWVRRAAYLFLALSFSYHATFVVTTPYAPYEWPDVAAIAIPVLALLVFGFSQVVNEQRWLWDFHRAVADKAH